MELKELTKKQLNQVLKKAYKENFPRIERKSSRCINKLLKGGNYFCYGAFENKKLLAFFSLKYKTIFYLTTLPFVETIKTKTLAEQHLNFLKKGLTTV